MDNFLDPFCTSSKEKRRMLRCITEAMKTSRYTGKTCMIYCDNHLQTISEKLACKCQAWSEATKKSMVRRASVCDSMPYCPRIILHLQDHIFEWRRNTLVACSQWLDPCNCSWSYHHPPQTWHLLPLSRALQRSLNNFRSLRIFLIYTYLCIHVPISSAFHVNYLPRYMTISPTAIGLRKVAPTIQASRNNMTVCCNSSPWFKAFY